MKKLIFLLLAFMATVAVNAEQVSRQKALQMARQFMPGKQFGEAKSFARTGSPTDQEPFYIFNAEGKKGFVVVSGDDRTEPILGYSDRGEISVENMPENLKYWLDCYEMQMRSLDLAKVASTRGVTRSVDRAAIAPLIKTKWDQGAPYNLMCPDGSYVDYNEPGYNSANRCVTGCVATAMAQVMYFHQWPESCGPIDQYDSFQALPATTFKWDKMKTEYSLHDTDEAADAVAELMRYCGQAVEMNYGLSKNGGSSAYVSAWHMATYFGYSKNARDVCRWLYSLSDWENLIYQELVNGRPVLYGGSSASAGHQFICDGYDGNGLFHFNWGWSGDSDGFFVLSLANPKELGSGGGTNTDGYSYIQDAIIGLVKPAEGEVENPAIYGLVSNDENWVAKYNRSSGAEDFAGVSLPRIIFMQYSYFGDDEVWPDYDLVCAWGLYKEGELIEVYGTTSVTLTNEANAMADAPEITFGGGLPDGTYMLRQVYKPQGNAAWMPCEMLRGDYYRGMSYIKAIISGNTLTLSKANEDDYSSDITVNSVSFSPTSIEAGRAVEVTVNLTNNGDAFQELICLRYGTGKRDYTMVCGSVEPGKTGTVKLHFVPKAVDVIPLIISTDDHESNVIWNAIISPSGLGDANGSGFVDFDDVKAISDHILGKNPPGFVVNNANINGDSKVDAADLVLLLDMLKIL